MTKEEIEDRLDELSQECVELEGQLHHFPEGCQCDIDDWRDGRINLICNNYEEDEDTDLCKHCEHLEECHGR
jgi:predicted transcriptional regulator